MRFTAITIENFKNVKYGHISFIKPSVPDEADILALYGQNGSGKSALIDCLHLFKLLLCGESAPDRFANYIYTGADSAKITYELDGEVVCIPGCFPEITAESGRRFAAVYEVELVAQETTSRDGRIQPQKLQIKSEVLKGRWEDGGRLKVLFSAADQVGPKVWVDNLLSYTDIILDGHPLSGVSNEEEAAIALASLSSKLHEEGKTVLASQELAVLLTMPFIEQMLGQFGFGSENARRSAPSDLQYVFNTISSFANNNLFVVGTKESEEIESGRLSLFYDKSTEGFYSLFSQNQGDKEDPYVSTDPAKPTLASKAKVLAIMQTIRSINPLLKAIVPGLTLDLHQSPQEADDDFYQINKDGKYSVSIDAVRETSRLPLSCESRGIQKIVSVAWLLINVYNRKGFTAVVDELDAGIFEYLLGEILDIIALEGKGQLIFTSHNLRPLEVLDKRHIAFSTTNPKNRYIRMRNVKTTNNLRDFYFRSILLGGQEESVYDDSESDSISVGFILAGSDYGKK